MTTYIQPSMSTTSAWQRPLTHATSAPSRNNARSGWISVEKTPVEKDINKLIQKADDHALLLLELLTLGDRPTSLQELKGNEILQQVYSVCQDYSVELARRLAEDEDDQEEDPTSFDFSAYDTSATAATTSSTSSHNNHTATTTTAMVEREVRVAALLATLEQLQQALREYSELQDFLTAKQLQTAEDFYFEAAQPISGTAASRVAAVHRDPDNDDEMQEEEDELVPRSKQPIEYRLDPRMDFRANQRRLKNGKLSQEQKEARMEREREKVVVDPSKVMTASLKIVEENEQPASTDMEEDEKEHQSTSTTAASKTPENTQVETEEQGVVIDEIAPVSAQGYLSDDSWQEIDGEDEPTRGDETDSGSSSILVTVDPASAVPTTSTLQH